MQNNDFETEEPTKADRTFTDDERKWMSLGRERAEARAQRERDSFQYA